MLSVADAPAPVRTARLRDLWRRPFDLWERLGLRARVTTLFATGALLLSVAMGCLAYFTTAHFLLTDKVNAAISQSVAGANTVQNALAVSNLNAANLPGLLNQIDASSGAASLLVWNDIPYSSNTFLLSEQTVPARLLALVERGIPATQTVTVDGTPRLIVGLPVQSGTQSSASYFAMFNLADLDHTLHVLALALALGGMITTVLGGVIGWVASARTLRPLAAVSRAAVAIAGGDLDTRLQATSDDPDLAMLTASFNRMVDQLQERIERDTRFTSDVSHELRSPLTTLANTVGVLEAHADELSPRARQALELLAADLRRFERMVRELLEISRADAAADVSLEDVDPGELVRRAVAASSLTLPSVQVEPAVWVDPALEGARILVDKRRFERVVSNLLDNAALYGGGATRVAAELGPKSNGHATVVVAVEDAGPGVPVEERKHIFERFYRGQASGRRGAGTGTGLGLALVAEHVRLIGGTVGIEDAPGGGARFTVELPVSEDVAS
jgi:two-component system, OmpR family, sensor histidine kinase MtrB